MHLVPVTIKILSLLVLWPVWVAELIVRYFVCSLLACIQTARWNGMSCYAEICGCGWAIYT